MNKRKYILQVMGMKSLKYGGLERFMISLANELLKEDIYTILVYNEIPHSELYLKNIEQSKIVIEIADATKPLEIFRKLFYLKRNYDPLIVHSHFQSFYPNIFVRALNYKFRVSSLRMMQRNDKNEEVNSKSELGKKAKLHSFINIFSNNSILAVSNAVRNQYMRIFPSSRNKVETFYMGGDKNNYSRTTVREKFDLDNDLVHIACIAFAEPIKGVDILVDAIKNLKEKYQSQVFKLHLFGLNENIPFTITLKEKVADYGLENLIIFEGIVDNASEYLKGMDIYCQPSRSEALPNTIMEAAMASLPTVASNVGGIPEVVIDGKTGFLFEKDNSDDLAKKLKILIDDEDRRLQFGKLARKNMEDNFNREKQIKDLVEKYKTYI